MRVENSIHIAAPIEEVWAVTVDVEKWPQWTPTVTSVRLMSSEAIRIGTVACIKQPLQEEAEWTVTELVPGHRFAWETKRTGLHIVGTHHLSVDHDGTRNVLTVDASGVLAVVFWPMLHFAMNKALADENRGLKSRCEARSKADLGQ